MKGLSPLLGMILVMIISVSVVVTVLDVGLPAIDRAREIMLFGEAKENMVLLNNKIEEISLQGEGSSSRLNLIINGGQYDIDPVSDEISVTLESKHKIVGVDVSYTEDGIDIQGEEDKVVLIRKYENVDITDGGAFVKGNQIINIKNEGFDDTLDKQIIKITLS